MLLLFSSRLPYVPCTIYQSIARERIFPRPLFSGDMEPKKIEAISGRDQFESEREERGCMQCTQVQHGSQVSEKNGLSLTYTRCHFQTLGSAKLGKRNCGRVNVESTRERKQNRLIQFRSHKKPLAIFFKMFYHWFSLHFTSLYNRQVYRIKLNFGI